MKRTNSSSSEVRRKLDRIRAIRGNAEATREFVLGVIESEGNAELLSAALRALGEHVRYEDHPLIRSAYEYYAEDGRRRDSGGQVRVEVLRVLWNLHDREDTQLALEASRVVEQSLNGNGELIRAAGLALLGALDAEAATFRAIAMLGSSDASPMSGEPSLTAARLLANLGEHAALAMYVLRTGRASLPDVTAEALRGLAGVPASHLQPILEHFAREEDDVVLLGLCDLLVTLDPDPMALAMVQRLLTTGSTDELYAVLVTSIVASRRDDLLGVLLETFPAEVRQPRLAIALDALKHAPPTPEVESAMSQLGQRLAKTK